MGYCLIVRRTLIFIFQKNEKNTVQYPYLRLRYISCKSRKTQKSVRFITSTTSCISFSGVSTSSARYDKKFSFNYRSYAPNGCLFHIIAHDNTLVHFFRLCISLSKSLSVYFFLSQLHWSYGSNSSLVCIQYIFFSLIH